MTEQTAKSVNITRTIDEAPFSGFLVQIVVLCGAVAFLDGLDSTSIGLAGPLIAKTLKLSPAHLGPIFSAALFGAMLGALSFGLAGDRFGRKRMLVIATLLFGVFTVATAFAASFGGLIAVRFFAGIGLGGATPCFIALASEYAPAARRAMVTSFVWTAFPLGAIAGSFLNYDLLSHFGWPSIFLVGGGIPVLVFAALMLWLPESIRFLVLKNRDAARVHRIARRILPGLDPGARIIADEEIVQGAPFKHLFSEGRTPETLLLWIPFLTLYGTAAGVVLWVPSLMHSHGIALPKASLVLGISGIGSIFGAASAGRLMEKFGPVAVLAPSFIIGAISVIAAGFFAGSIIPMAIDLAFTGICIGGLGGSGLLALAALAYPTAMRSTGLGWAIGFGRFGQVLVPLLTSLAMLHGWMLGQVFIGLGISLIVGAISLVLLRLRAARIGAARLTVA